MNVLNTESINNNEVHLKENISKEKIEIMANIFAEESQNVSENNSNCNNLSNEISKKLSEELSQDNTLY